VAAGVLGMLFLIALTVAIDDIPASAPASHPSYSSDISPGGDNVVTTSGA
jgi:hypothetical protein